MRRVGQDTNRPPVRACCRMRLAYFGHAVPPVRDSPSIGTAGRRRIRLLTVCPPLTESPKTRGEEVTGPWRKGASQSGWARAAGPASAAAWRRVGCCV
jgi:hypothetical protein